MSGSSTSSDASGGTPATGAVVTLGVTGGAEEMTTAGEADPASTAPVRGGASAYTASPDSIAPAANAATAVSGPLRTGCSSGSLSGWGPSGPIITFSCPTSPGTAPSWWIAIIAVAVPTA